ncbi:selenide, water dikinase SelD [Mangrovicoccus algicola]|uniref:Selenide, water dikinase SelD n=1 Tax=Mangrovicoccus algicola TaxID=2771008 RepID=A0A8J6YU25_9RHOB|nr:selenide, water dikinase SelD [Mangrovicoccus algicola]MBE3639273.1 selenide, water dikinase SelD [Mangrovicoccus algicola]
MNPSALPLLRDLVLAGGGHAHALILRRWGMRPVPGIRLSVINPGPVAAYSGMLPGHVAGHYDSREMEIDLVRLARFAGARLIAGAVTGIDAQARRLDVAGRGSIGYDLLSLDIGITTRMTAPPGFAEHALPAKPLAGFAAGWRDFLAQVAAGHAAPRVAVIGAGLAGAELALSMRHRLSAIAAGPAVTLIDHGAALAGVPARARRRLLAELAACGIAVIEDAPVAAFTASGPRLADGRQIAAALTVGAAGAAPAPWLQDSGLALRDGFVAVDAHLRSLSHETVFACGDCAHLSASPRPKAGVFAVRAAPVLEHNLRAALTETPLRPFRPQRSYLKLVSLGPKSALAQKGPLLMSGPRMWRWKDRIDRRFMEKFDDLPPMPAPALPRGAPPALAREFPSDAPVCGGCGAKVGAGALSHALAGLAPPQAAELQNRPGDDAAILKAGDRWQVISTDHLRAVTEDWGLMARIALNHAMGDVWAMGATPQLALAQIVIPRMSAALQERTLAEITAATADLCTRIGAALAGGHTTMGAETTIGFTVTGLSPQPPVSKAGARPGDVLILTGALGSGTILAGEMRMQARGAWVADLLGQMAEPPVAEAAALAGRAHAMTDVTGFGLAGHALEMARASGVQMVLQLDDLPFHDGARELCAAGIRSTIYEDNRAATNWQMSGRSEDPRVPLLHDPQTCGGFLAALPRKAAEEALAEIGAAGGTARIVGHVAQGAPGIVLG